MSPKIDRTPEELAEEEAERIRVDATPVGALAQRTYEAAMKRSGLSDRTIEGAWAKLDVKLRVQWIAGAQIAFDFVADDLGARAAASVILGGAPDFEALDRFLDHYSEDPS